jgi:hypothetical protein
MLCEKNLDLAMLKKMFGIQQHRRQGNGRATKEIGEVAAMQFIPAVGTSVSVPETIETVYKHRSIIQYNTP